ncbi:MAG: 16S rRNA (guanine(966)-N(2))-methyltransferase RsmD [Patescibacteria group bacterium]|nr:16S rRNA (guanine(966)-N(2))-methyltransferase RsmD [Patescibacteria group bacterium]
MRIITGTAKGQKIKIPKKEIRPAQSIVRHSIFSMLQGLIKDAYVLDLFAGSGSYGLEALSRGAKKAIFVDIDNRCTKTIKENLKNMSLESRGEVIKMDAAKFVENADSTKFDLIFLSPPYSMGSQIHILKQLKNILSPKGIIIFDHAKETKLPQEVDGLKTIRQRSFGATTISILAKKTSSK